jgi:glycine betaine/proline transport system substrate-binding protein
MSVRFKTLLRLFIGLALVLSTLTFLGCPSDDPDSNGSQNGDEPLPTLIFGDLSWDSAQFHNRVAAFILEQGYGYGIEYIYGDTIPIFLGVSRGDVDIEMECWVENQQEAYDEAIAAGTVTDLGENFWDNWQGWLVPRYVVEGDPARGIEPMAPGLVSVTDLPQYIELFKDPEDPAKGRFYSCIAGWECEKINEDKMTAYGLDEYYNIFLPGSGTALLASLESAYLQGEPWFGYYWEPTWALGKFDMIALEEPPYDEAVWNANHACEYPAVHVNIVINAGLEDKAPEAVDFLEKYIFTTALVNEALAYMQANEATVEDAAEWFLANHEEVWTQWVSADIANKVKAALS